MFLKLVLLAQLFGWHPVAYDGAERPKAFRAMEQARARLKTAEVRWSMEDRRSGTKRFYTSRCAGEDFIVVDRGDEEGVLHRNPDGSPVTRFSYDGPRHFLVRGDEAWDHTQNAIGATLYQEHVPRFFGWDIRALGATPRIPPAGRGFREAIQTFGGDVAVPATYRTRKLGKKIEIIANVGEGWSHRFVVDPDRGWNPERITTRGGGENAKVYRDTRITLKKWGDVWFPETVAVFAPGESRPRQVIHVDSATFNRPTHRKKLTPEDIGVEVGTNITVQRRDRNGPRIPWDGYMGWDGKKLVKYDQMVARIRAGELEYGPNFKRESAKARERIYGQAATDKPARGGVQPAKSKPARPPAPAKTSSPTPVTPEGVRYLEPHIWDKWFRGIAHYYEFTEAQRNAGQSILKEMHDRAEKEIERKEPPKAGDEPVDIVAIHARLFLELRARIEGLMTTKQREAYEAANRAALELHKKKQARKKASEPARSDPKSSKPH